MKNKIILKTLIPLILSALFISASLTLVSAQTLTPGVTKGDVFSYTYIANWKSTDPNIPVPDVIANLNKTASFQITITDVSGTVVNAEVASTYRNGTTYTETGFVDVQSGSIHLPYGITIIAGNLNANDKIYPSSGDAIINNTVTRTYPSGDRPTNERIVETTSENHQDKTDIYYDKAKGIAVSSYYESVDTFGSETETFTETITNTNSQAWAVIPEFPSTALLLVLLLAVPVALVAAKKGLMNRKFSATSQNTPSRF